MKNNEANRDERKDLARVVNELKETHGPRVAAHLLYHQALTLTREADRAALAEAESKPSC